MKWGAAWLLMGTLALGMTGCGDDDPNYDNVTPPTVAANYSINGRVTTVGGEGLLATVTVDGSTTIETEADGTFTVKVAAGTHTLKAEAEGKQPKEQTIEVAVTEEGTAVSWSITLSNVGTSVVAAADGSAEGAMKSETLTGNNLAEIDVDLKAGEGALAGGSTIVMTSIYSFDDAIVTKASERKMLYGVALSSDDSSASLSKPVELGINVGSEMANLLQVQKLENGEWVSADFTANGDQIVVSADELTTYALSLEASISAASETAAITLDSSLWDNLTGGSDLSVANVGYSYKNGLDLAVGSSRMQAYLVELLARQAGTSSLSERTGSYDLDVTLPIGTAMSITASQKVTTLTATVENYSASAKYYGDIAFKVSTYNRQHTGGGSL